MSTAILILAAIVAVATVFRIVRRRDPELVPATEVRSAEPEARPERYAVQRLRILVVDDNPHIGRTVTQLLDAHEVATATSGEAALSTLALDDKFDAILYALMLPGMTGVAFAAAIADRHPALRPRMAFLIDGSSTPETLRLLALSDIRWVTKPLKHALLATCVSELAAERAEAP